MNGHTRPPLAKRPQIPTAGDSLARIGSAYRTKWPNRGATIARDRRLLRKARIAPDRHVPRTVTAKGQAAQRV